MTAARSQEPAVYAIGNLPLIEGDAVIAQALRILEGRLSRAGTTVFDTPTAVKDYCRLQFAALEHEVFACLWLDHQHRLLQSETLFRGSLNQTSVYPREVVKSALRHNAGAVVLVHNHPSGSPEPSRADEFLTSTLKSALALVDVRVIDHMVVGASSVVSFAERGLL